MGDCPVCAHGFDSASALETHVNSHFADEEPDLVQPSRQQQQQQQQQRQQAVCAQCGRQVPAAELASHELAHQLEQDDLQQAAAAVAAAGGGGRGAAQQAQLAADGAAAEVLDAEAAAALAAAEWEADEPGASGGGAADGGSSEDAAHREQLEQLYLQQLQERYGFVDKQRPGCCRLCGEEGHWMRECPRNPERQAAQQRMIDPQPDLIAASQQAAPATAFSGSSIGGTAGTTSSGSGSGSLIQLLAACLEQQQVQPRGPQYLAALCGPVHHFGSTLFSSGWGCGYNNMQMLASHLLEARPEARQVLFGGAGWVPDIPALQAWLEAAWQAGFDCQGAEQLGGRVQATQKWVGTTECAALLRYFGLRAQICDFGVGTHQQPAAAAAAAAAGAGAGAGGSSIPPPSGGGGAVAVHPGVACDGCGQCPIRGDRYRSQALPDYDLCSACRAGSAGAAAGPFCRMMPTAMSTSASANAGMQQQHGSNAGSSSSSSQGMQERLLQWVWRYFMGVQEGDGQAQGGSAATSSGGGGGDGGSGDGSAAAQQWPGAHPLAPPSTHPAAGAAPSAKRPRHAALSPPAGRVRLTGKAPLYFQHEGHSRTIIGIERRLVGQGLGQRAEYTLLVLDPSTSGGKLAAALQQRQGWQRLLKRGPHTLRKQQYQLLHVQPGVAAGAELAALKLVAASERF